MKTAQEILTSVFFETIEDANGVLLPYGLYVEETEPNNVWTVRTNLGGIEYGVINRVQPDATFESPVADVDASAPGMISDESDAPAMVDSTSDKRTVNNVVRHEYRVLNEEDKAKIKAIKDVGAVFIELVQELGSSRELSLAITKIEEAVFWAVKDVTK